MKTQPTDAAILSHLTELGRSRHCSDDYLTAVLDGNIKPRDWDPEKLETWRRRAKEVGEAREKACVWCQEILPPLNARLTEQPVGWKVGFSATGESVYNPASGTVVPYIRFSIRHATWVKFDCTILEGFAVEERVDACLFALQKNFETWVRDIQRARGSAKVWQKAYAKVEAETKKRQRDEWIQKARAESDDKTGTVVIGPWGEADDGQDD